MAAALTVSQLNTYVAFKFKGDKLLKGLAVKGEISNLSTGYASGHIYFTLKDEKAMVRAVMFSSNYERIKFTPENGMKVTAVVNVELYEKNGEYHVIVLELIPDGVGEQHIRQEQLKSELAQIGVFSSERKKGISKKPSSIAVVTSSAGAALQDIINVISRRYPICRLIIIPSQVQGETAPSLISKAILKADSIGADTIILARGGGSAEDLNAFNTKEVVMAVFKCKTPVISAVGHETDITFTDLAADLRAPTPSAAAELATPMISDMISELDKRNFQLKQAVLRKIDLLYDKAETFTSLIVNRSPSSRLEAMSQKLAGLDVRLKDAIGVRLKLSEQHFISLCSIIESLSPLKTLQRGYAVVRKGEKLVTCSGELSIGDKINIIFADSEISATVDKFN